jgi:hypothetical protein
MTLEGPKDCPVNHLPVGLPAWIGERDYYAEVMNRHCEAIRALRSRIEKLAEEIEKFPGKGIYNTKAFARRIRECLGEK